MENASRREYDTDHAGSYGEIPARMPGNRRDTSLFNFDNLRLLFDFLAGLLPLKRSERLHGYDGNSIPPCSP